MHPDCNQTTRTVIGLLHSVQLDFVPLQVSGGLASTSLAPAAASMPKVSGSTMDLPISIPLTAHFVEGLTS